MTVAARQPPGLVVKTLSVTFVAVLVLLLLVFVFVTMGVSEQVRQSVTANLESSQRMFATLESRRQRELMAQASTLAENPTLKAALDTYQTEVRTSSDAVKSQLFATIDGELRKVAASVESDAVVLVDMSQHTLAAAGRMGGHFPRGRPVILSNPSEGTFDGIIHVGGAVFRVVAVPLQFGDGASVGALYLATNLDAAYAEELSRLSGTRTAIVSDGLTVASTLPASAVREFERVASSRPVVGTIVLNGETYAFRRLVAVGETTFYALGSIDESSRGPMRQALWSLGFTAIGAISLALLGSVTLAGLLARPIGELSSSLARMAASHDVSSRLPLTGSSREIDALTATFNELMASVALAEAQTEAAYTGAIRALATALDARDRYTAGHSDRVSALSVGIGRVLSLSADDLEVLRLGALLHDIGKIGVPDDVLRKPGALTEAEFDAIKQHPVLGARILRPVPFLARHIPIVELHHERPDGRGYPVGLRGDDIPLAARIVHVADAYDAMTSARAYRGARPSIDALRELWRCAGTEFHAEIVGALVTALPGVTSEAGEVVLERG
ncbi:MAG: HD-GYP domain-containing protein [Vicinamibacterales bacterium]